MHPFLATILQPVKDAPLHYGLLAVSAGQMLLCLYGLHLCGLV